MTLKEYYESPANQIREEPTQTREAMADLAQTLEDQERERQEETQRAAALKESISQQLTQGNEPQLILYTAIKGIGCLTHDAQWAEDCKARLDKIYSGLEQESLLTDNAAEAQKRLNEQSASFNAQAKRSLERQLKSYKKLYDGLTAALNALEEVET